MRTAFTIEVDRSHHNDTAREISDTLSRLGYQQTVISAWTHTHETPKTTIGAMGSKILPVIDGKASLAINGSTIKITPNEPAGTAPS